LACGLTVSLLIRSKIFHVGKGRSIGGDFIYERLQSRLFAELRHQKAMEKNQKIGQYASVVVRESTPAVLSIACRQVLPAQGEYVKSYNRQLATLEKRRPEPPFSADSGDWRSSCHNHARLAAD